MIFNLFKNFSNWQASKVYETRKRPVCKRCKGPLDFWWDPGLECWTFYCNNPSPIRTDEEFWKAWNGLPGDAVAVLNKDGWAD